MLAVEVPVDSDETYVAIGKFIFEFSQAEYTIRVLLAKEMRLDDRLFSAVVEAYDVNVLVATAIAVFKITRSPNCASSIENLLNQFRRLNDTRNRVAHGLWVPFIEGGTVHHRSRQKALSISYREQRLELEARSDELRTLRSALEREFYSMD